MPGKATLDPETRLLYGDSLQAPPGYRFDAGVATTFSMDFQTALAVPVSLALFAAEDRETLLADPITLLEGVEQVASRLAVYADAGQIHAEPSAYSRLCALLERVVVEVSAHDPRGSFHPKIWALRFKPLSGSGPDRLRLLILSRNLTSDRSWDAVLRLDGARIGRTFARNRAIADLVARLPDLAVRSIDPLQRQLTLSVADDLRHADWEMPDGCDEDGLSFHVNGLAKKPWLPDECARIGIVSPFCDTHTLSKLAGRARSEASILISRPDQLAAVDPTTLNRFSRVAVLDERAEREDGEDEQPNSMQGLHAKIFVQEQGWDTWLTIGSGNATSPAFGSGINVEVFATLKGRRAKLGGITDILGETGFGRLTRQYQAGELDGAEMVDPDTDRLLREARRSLARGALSLRCEPALDEDGAAGWRLWLLPPVGGLPLNGICTARSWPITRGEHHARNILPALRNGSPVDMGVMALIDLTRFMAFSIAGNTESGAETFSTGLDIVGLPSSRDTAILRWVIDSREKFFRYLRLLLSELGDPFGAAMAAQGSGMAGNWQTGTGDAPLLEALVRSHCAGDGRLATIERLMTRLEAGGQDQPSSIPQEFLTLWQVFRTALNEMPHVD